MNYFVMSEDKDLFVDFLQGFTTVDTFYIYKDIVLRLQLKQFENVG